jgi:hypothetical protein
MSLFSAFLCRNSEYSDLKTAIKPLRQPNFSDAQGGGPPWVRRGQRPACLHGPMQQPVRDTARQGRLVANEPPMIDAEPSQSLMDAPPPSATPREPMQTVRDAPIASWARPLKHRLGLPAPPRSLLGRSSARSSLRAHNRDQPHRRRCAPSSVR